MGLESSIILIWSHWLWKVKLLIMSKYYVQKMEIRINNVPKKLNLNRQRLNQMQLMFVVSMSYTARPIFSGILKCFGNKISQLVKEKYSLFHAIWKRVSGVIISFMSHSSLCFQFASGVSLASKLYPILWSHSLRRPSSCAKPCFLMINKASKKYMRLKMRIKRWNTERKSKASTKHYTIRKSSQSLLMSFSKSSPKSSDLRNYYWQPGKGFSSRLILVNSGVLNSRRTMKFFLLRTGWSITRKLL